MCDQILRHDTYTLISESFIRFFLPFVSSLVREAEKKVIFLMAVPLRPPLNLLAVGIFSTNHKKTSQKNYFFS